ncbi:snrp-27 [Pristionchus pacificus]|uniref:U4/U6.U5 small nuclear ribonucleoprotein 27 kDa protein n=1 Tax=Pristionchus pacificus TaxID=54126 RepID=A0A2A6CCE0_PRIPA|nr:snrp-27 [Pristionchus pacificus]|eukprot:PDM75854.1 snrp-27 [Pristionchus pacificus]
MDRVRNKLWRAVGVAVRLIAAVVRALARPEETCVVSEAEVEREETIETGIALAATEAVSVGRAELRRSDFKEKRDERSERSERDDRRRGDERRRDDDRGDRRERDGRRRTRSRTPEEAVPVDLTSIAGIDDEVAKMMGFGGFDTTKNKKVDGNDVGEVKINKQRRYRQYMNRKGGFNRPLDWIA